jgi:molybdate transport system regulatory protein
MADPARAAEAVAEGRAVPVSEAAPELRIRIALRPGTAMGPGKADLLEAIRETGSIAAAGRRFGMSYKRAWMLVDTMNAAFSEPVVTAAKGGARGGGAALTETGAQVLALYRRIEAASRAAAEAEMAALAALLGDMSGGK